MAELKERRGKSRSTIYSEISRGLFLRPFRLGPRAGGWFQHESDLVDAARAAGKSDKEIRQLVANLEAARGADFDRLLKDSNLSSS